VRDRFQNLVSDYAKRSRVKRHWILRQRPTMVFSNSC
jgi:hypothetical protein